MAAPFGGDLVRALSRVRARMLVMPSATDRLLPVESARDIAAHVRNATYVEVPSARGHLGWRAVEGSPETLFINRTITRFFNPEG